MTQEGAARARPRFAVVGSGIAGLSASYLLGQDAEVHLFEREAGLGMDAHGVDVGFKDGSVARMDAPLRVFSRAYYPNLTKLYSLVGVDFAPADYSFSCSLGPRRQRSFFRYANWRGRVTYPTLPLGSWLSSGWTFLSLMAEMVRFMLRAPQHLATGALADLTFEEYLSSHGFSRDFADKLLLPMLCVVCTCSYDDVRAYKADVLVEYLALKHGLYSSKQKESTHCRVLNNVKDVVKRLSVNADVVHLRTTVTGLRPRSEAEGGGVELRFVTEGQEGEQLEIFDQVVIAAQAPHALKMLSEPRPGHQEALGAFTYSRTRVVVHTDPELMPVAPADWSPLNILVDTAKSMPMVTVWMNTFDSPHQSLSSDVFQTWNPLVEPDPALVQMDAMFDRPVLDRSSERGIRALEGMQGVDGVWFVGAYSRYSMPLLENGVVSAIDVASKLGIPTPWGAVMPPADRYPQKGACKVEGPSPLSRVLRVGTCAAALGALLALKGR